TPSPTRAQASRASTSSQLPGNEMTPNFIRRLPPSWGVAVEEYFVVLDERVREQPLAHLGQPRRVGDLEFDQPADAHVADALESERRQRALDSRPLGIEDPCLWANQDACLHHPDGSPGGGGRAIRPERRSAPATRQTARRRSVRRRRGS